MRWILARVSTAAAVIAVALAMSTPAVQARERAEVVTPGGVLTLDVVRTLKDREIGLMGRRSVAPNAGMLFLFDEPHQIRMWMLDTPVKLDMIFLKGGVVTSVVRGAQPCLDLPCPFYSSRGPADAVIEVAAGRARALGIRRGVTLPLPE